MVIRFYFALFFFSLHSLCFRCERFWCVFGYSCDDSLIHSWASIFLNSGCRVVCFSYSDLFFIYLSLSCLWLMNKMKNDRGSLDPSTFGLRNGYNKFCLISTFLLMHAFLIRTFGQFFITIEHAITSTQTNERRKKNNTQNQNTKISNVSIHLIWKMVYHYSFVKQPDRISNAAQLNRFKVKKETQ